MMAYPQTRDGVGRVWCDDVELRVRRGPVPRVLAPKIARLTDRPDHHATVRESHALPPD
ncbi:MAG: hypothetical protein U1E05_18255 [Patescibacteria group bacterium]|nr:hypothetical protein [Patescibacteria group bacterium]